MTGSTTIAFVCLAHVVAWTSSAIALSPGPTPAAPAIAPAATVLDDLTLPAGGDDFRQAVLQWSVLPPPKTDASIADILEMPVVTFAISSYFGIRRDPMTRRVRAHLGIDIPDVMGAPVRAAAQGTIVFSGWSRGYGNLIQIDHGSGGETRYGHLSTITVSRGDIVTQGMVIGFIGSTGHSTGPHLHFEVRQDGAAQNPLIRFGGAFGGGVVLPQPKVQAAVQPHQTGFEHKDNLLPQPRLR